MKILSYFLLSCMAVSTSHADLVAHWPLDTDANDATGNGFDGTIVGGTVNFGQAGANANTGSAAAFPDNGHIDIPFDEALNPGSFTVALWANAATTEGFASPITSRDDVIGTGTHGYVLYNNSDGFWDFWTGDGDVGWDGMAGDPVVLDTWTHIAITYDAPTDTKTLWINGVISITDTLPQSGPTQYAPNGLVEMEALHIGSGADNGESFYFDGLIDDVGIWNEVLEESVIQGIITGGIASGLPDPFLSVANPVELTLDGAVQQFDLPVKNGGQSQSLTVSAATFDGDPNFSVTTLPGAIAPGDSENLVITFDPLGANGIFEADLEITSNDGLNATRTTTVRGVIHDPMLGTAATVDLGQNTSGTITLTNNGANRVLQISEIGITGDSDYFSLTAIPSSIAANGGSEDITVSFDSLGEEGNFSVTLTINTDDPINPAITVLITANVLFTEKLVAWWPLDLDGTDASGNGFDGVVEGAPIVSEGANGATGGSLEFDGFSTRIDVPFDQALNPEDFTVTLWANAATTAGFASPITSRDDVNGGVSTHGFILYNDNGGVWNFWTGDGIPGWDTMAGEGVVMDTWTHIAMTFDSVTETKSIWINGIISATETAPNQYSPNGTVEMESLHIGAGQDNGENFWFAGKIDDVGLFRTALTSEEINAIMTEGIGGFTGAARDLPLPRLTSGLTQAR